MHIASLLTLCPWFLSSNPSIPPPHTHTCLPPAPWPSWQHPLNLKQLLHLQDTQQEGQWRAGPGGGGGLCVHT
jgi:hypothetical protein